MEHAKLILLATTLFGMMGGIFLAGIAHPTTDYAYWLPIFALLGIIISNAILIIGYGIFREEPS